MRRVITSIVIFAGIIIGCAVCLAGCSDINSGTEDVSYNGIVYERTDFPNYNLQLSENNTKYIGDFVETYNYGYEIPWEVYALNGEENVLASAHAVWIKPGYVFPGEFGEDFSSVEYVRSDGIDFFMIEDEYTEIPVTLAMFEGSVKLDDIVESEPSSVTDFTVHDTIRFSYKNHKDMFLLYTLCSHDGSYYLNICQSDGTDALFRIKAEYVGLLTSEIADKQ